MGITTGPAIAQATRVGSGSLSLSIVIGGLSCHHGTRRAMSDGRPGADYWMGSAGCFRCGLTGVLAAPGGIAILNDHYFYPDF